MDATIISRPRQGGKTTELIDSILDTLTDMREGRRKREPIHVVTVDHQRQQFFLQAFDEACRRRGLDLVKADNLNLYSERSLNERARGSRQGPTFVDDADDFDGNPVELVCQAWPGFDSDLTITATPVDSTLLMLAWWDAATKQRLEEQAHLGKIRAEQRADDLMYAFMITYILWAER